MAGLFFTAQIKIRAFFDGHRLFIFRPRTTPASRNIRWAVQLFSREKKGGVVSMNLAVHRAAIRRGGREGARHDIDQAGPFFGRIDKNARMFQRTLAFFSAMLRGSARARARAAIFIRHGHFLGA